MVVFYILVFVLVIISLSMYLFFESFLFRTDSFCCFARARLIMYGSDAASLHRRRASSTEVAVEVVVVAVYLPRRRCSSGRRACSRGRCGWSALWAARSYPMLMLRSNCKLVVPLNGSCFSYIVSIHLLIFSLFLHNFCDVSVVERNRRIFGRILTTAFELK